MNIKDQLLKEHSKANTKLIVNYISSSEELLSELMHCFFSNTYRVSQRSAMVVSYFFYLYPKMMEKYKKKIILNLKEDGLEVAIKRNSLRILQFQEIPENLTAPLFDCCLQYLIDRKEPIAVKVFSMTILYNCCKKYYDLKSELIPLLENELYHSKSKGIQSRGRKVLAQLRKL